MACSESDIRITTDTPYLDRLGDLRAVCCDEFRKKNLARHNGTTMYYLNQYQA